MTVAAKPVLRVLGMASPLSLRFELALLLTEGNFPVTTWSGPSMAGLPIVRLPMTGSPMTGLQTCGLFRVLLGQTQAVQVEH
jgi:hypothetical protein